MKKGVEWYRVYGKMGETRVSDMKYKKRGGEGKRASSIGYNRRYIGWRKRNW